MILQKWILRRLSNKRNSMYDIKVHIDMYMRTFPKSNSGKIASNISQHLACHLHKHVKEEVSSVLIFQ